MTRRITGASLKLVAEIAKAPLPALLSKYKVKDPEGDVATELRTFGGIGLGGPGEDGPGAPGGN